MSKVWFLLDRTTDSWRSFSMRPMAENSPGVRTKPSGTLSQ